MKKIMIPIVGLTMLLLAVSFGSRLNNQDAAHAQSNTVQQVKQVEPDKEINDDSISPVQSKSAQEKIDQNENEKSGVDTDGQKEDAN